MKWRRCPHCDEPYGPGKVTVGWQPCDCTARDEAGGHEIRRCWHCGEITERVGCVGQPPRQTDTMQPL